LPHVELDPGQRRAIGRRHATAKKQHLTGFVGTLRQHIGYFECRRVRQVERTFDGLDAALSADIADICRFSFEKDVVEQRFFARLDGGYEDVGRVAIFIMGDFVLSHERKQCPFQILEDGSGAFSAHAFLSGRCTAYLPG
jgi:hypothetical protein